MSQDKPEQPNCGEPQAPPAADNGAQEWPEDYDLRIVMPTAGQIGVCVVPNILPLLTGYICAQAYFDGPAGYGIWAAVNPSASLYLGHLASGGTPPDSSDGNGNFQWSNLSGANFDLEGDGSLNSIAVWAQINLAGDEAAQSNTFYGRACWQTDCAQQSGRGPGLLTARHLWNVMATGFSRPNLDAYNGTYLLEMRHVDIQRDCLWESSPKGHGKPLVQLRCEFPRPITYRLTFQIRGYPPIEYKLCAGEWKQLGANKLYLNARTVPDGETAPPNLIVKPA